MNKNTLVRTAVVAVPLAIAAIVGAYVYKDVLFAPEADAVDTAQNSTNTEAKSEKKEVQAAAPATNDAGQGQGDAEPAAQSEQAAAEPAAVPIPPVKGPSFDVVGVEPTGETVVAGRSDAGAMVALTANGEVVGKSIANQAGEWTIILEEPLKPGDYDVGLEVHDEKGTSIEESEQRLIVSVPEGGKEQPLVVLNSPDAPSNILQKPATDDLIAQLPAQDGAEQNLSGAGDTQNDGTVVAALPAGENSNASTAGGAADAEQTARADAGTAPATTQETSAQPQSAAGTSDNGQAPGKTADAPAQGEATETAALSAGQTAAPASDKTASDTTATETAQSAQTGASQDETAVTAEAQAAQPVETQRAAGEVSGNGVQQEQTAQAAGAPAVQPQQQATAGGEPSVTVEAVESEPDKVYVAGTGKPGSSVRVYVGEEYQGEAKVNSSGRWLVQGTKNVPEGNVEVRADLIAQDGDGVDARAAVTFEKEQDKQIVLTKVVATGSGSGQGSQGADVQKSLPVVIIRKGDNLWRISRRLYGDGVRYTTIYQANQDQIRDPDLIYPGQVFLTPEGDVNWPDREQDASNRG